MTDPFDGRPFHAPGLVQLTTRGISGFAFGDSQRPLGTASPGKDDGTRAGRWRVSGHGVHRHHRNAEGLELGDDALQV